MKQPTELTADSLPFIHAAAGAGINFITSNPNDASILPKLHRILLDIQTEVSAPKPEDASPTSPHPDEEGIRPLVACSQCYVLYHNNPPKYELCLETCTP